MSCRFSTDFSVAMSDHVDEVVLLRDDEMSDGNADTPSPQRAYASDSEPLVPSRSQSTEPEDAECYPATAGRSFLRGRERERERKGERKGERNGERGREGEREGGREGGREGREGPEEHLTDSSTVALWRPLQTSHTYRSCSRATMRVSIHCFKHAGCTVALHMHACTCQRVRGGEGRGREQQR
jgi:hypothetical protein